MFWTLFVIAILLYFCVNMFSEDECGSKSNESESEENLVEKATKELEKDKLVVKRLRDFKKKMNAEVKVSTHESEARERFRAKKGSSIREETQKIQEKFFEERTKDKEQLDSLKKFKMKFREIMLKKTTQENRGEIKSEEKEMRELKSSNGSKNEKISKTNENTARKFQK